MASALLFTSSNAVSDASDGQQTVSDYPKGTIVDDPYSIPKQDINDMLLHIQAGIQQDKKQKAVSAYATNSLNDNRAASGIYDYIVIDSDYVYSYEEAPNQQPTLDIQKAPTDVSVYDPSVAEDTYNNVESVNTDTYYNLDHTYADPNMLSSSLAAQSSFQIADGIGGRQTIQRAGGYLSTLLQLPKDSEVQQEESAYNYSGFSSGAYEADMGLVYDSSVGFYSNRKGWKPTMTIKRNSTVASNSNMVAGYNDVQFRNAYASDSNVVLYVWYNYNGKARMKITGTAICTDRACTSEQNTSLTTIIETDSSSLNISKVDKWKLLSTVVSNQNHGRNKATYSSIKIDNTLVPSSAFDSPQTEAATITRDFSGNNNKVTITVSG
ncbi:YrpD family protein [Paenibacillus sp. SGZ-1009]|uniref:YrpD family protein n=1 Tax=Paenibacillus campi TaxID=3106031 RepID=UPI002B001691|nr:YrpD family protein [Paenibacillus sp. SGZ-1009]